MKNIKKLLAFVLAAAMLFALAVPAGAAGNDNDDLQPVEFEKIDNELVNVKPDAAKEYEETEEPAKYQPNEMVRVSIVLNELSTLDAGYATENIAANNAAMSYRANLIDRQNAVANAISAKALDGAQLDVEWNLTLAANIISANVPYGKIEAIKAVAGVADVFIETRYEPCVSSVGAADPNMATSSAQIGSPVAYAAGYTGAGERIAIIDTGLDTDHQSFAEEGYLYSLRKNAQKAGVSYEEYVAGLDLLTADEVASVWNELNFSGKYKGTSDKTYFTQKVPFGGNYVDKGLDITHDNDSQSEHGSHVAGIASANSYIANDKGGFTPALDMVGTQGVAPDAQLMIMKVFGKGGGAYDSDYMAAIEDAIVLGATSVNLSLGSANAGTSMYEGNDEYQAIMDGLTETGVLVVISAGNAGSWADQTTYGYLYNDAVSLDAVGSPGSYTNALTVASVDNDGTTGGYIMVGENQIFYSETSGYSNAPITTIAGEHDYIFFENTGADGAGANLLLPYKDQIKGKVVFCYRGDSSFYQKMDAAAKAGAIACIVVNNQPGVINMSLEGATSKIPCISITQADGEIIKAASTAGEGYYTGKLDVSKSVASNQFNSEYYTMSDFSSWGTPGSLELKPDITAPGGNIYSVNGLIKGGKSYENMSGTSMAAPQVTGMAALLGQAIKERGLEEKTGLTARQIQNSLLMSTAVPVKEADTDYYYSVIKQGAGLANIGEAVNADSFIMMFDGSNAGAADGKIKVELGDDPDKEGVYGFGFTLTNISDEAKQYSLGGEFFTQDVFDYFGDETYMLDTWVTKLSYGIDFNVNGEKLTASADVSNCDFNGDGKVDVNDVQALLDYDVKIEAVIENEDYADVDGDGYISANDAYTLLKVLNEGLVTVPAGESVSIWVTVGLSDYQKEIFEEYYPVGAYIEGYVFVGAMPTVEGVKGTSHSIPVLGFYGNWSDGDMFDVGTFNEYYAGTETRAPYLYDYNDIQGNSLLIKYAGDSTSYLFGGNPVVEDDVYMPERDAINAQVDDFSKMNFAVIRNASDSLLYIADDEGNFCGTPASLGPVDSAFYYESQQTWMNTGYSVGTNGMIKTLDENEHYTINLSLAPEYYTMDGEWELDELGEGATLSFGFTVDNTAPEIVEIYYSLINDEYLIIAQDNQYVAGAMFADTKGEFIGAIGSDPELECGGQYIISVPASALDDGKAMLSVYDYALNQSSYKLLPAVGSAAVESVTLNTNALEILRGNTAKLKVLVEPFEADETVIWTSSDESIATVSDKGVITAVANGECVITATSAKDETKFDECAVTVFSLQYTLEGVLQDADGNPITFNWNLDTDKTWSKVADIAYPVGSASIAGNDAIYLIDSVNAEPHTIKFSTGATIADGTNTDGIPYWDIATSKAFANKIYGIYGPYFFPVEDPSAIDAYGYNLQSLLTGQGASMFIAIESVGTYVQKSTTYEMLYALDDAGNMWTLVMYASGRNAGNLYSYGVEPSDLTLNCPGYDSYMYCSMVVSDDEYGSLFLSAFDGNTNQLFWLNEYTNGSDYWIESTPAGDVGNDVWPAALTKATFDGGEQLLNSVSLAEKFASVDVEANLFEGEKVLFSEIKDEVPGGGLNALPASAGIQSTADLAKDQSGVTVEVTVKDDDGNDVAANAADLVVAYDPSILKFESISINAQFKSYDVAEDYGMIMIGLVDEEGIAAGATAATVNFSVIEDVPTDVIVATSSHDGVISELEDFEDFDLHICPSYKFTDVSENDWFHEAVDYVVLNGYMSGVSETEFNPNGTLNRAQIVTVLYNIAGEPDIEGLENPFGDVNESDWFYAPVVWAYNNGITSGVDEGVFDPDGKVTRETMVIFLYNFVELMGGDMTVPDGATLDFADADAINAWAAPAVLWAVENGIISGIEIEGELYFQPAADATRAQIATILCNIA